MFKCPELPLGNTSLFLGITEVIQYRFVVMVVGTRKESMNAVEKYVNVFSINLRKFKKYITTLKAGCFVQLLQFATQA